MKFSRSETEYVCVNGVREDGEKVSLQVLEVAEVDVLKLGTVEVS